MIRVVADTNVLISAFMFGGLPGTFLDLALQGSCQLLTSHTLLDDLDEKLRIKFHVSATDMDLVRVKLESAAEIVSTVESLTVILEDPDDDRVLECAMAGRADYIVSSDRHLLQLRSYEGTAIITVRQFMDTIKPTA